MKQIWNCQKYFIFVVRTDHYYEVQSTKAFKQETGETYGCKFRDLSELRFGSVRSDLPLFIYSNHFIMRTENGLSASAHPPVTPEQLISDIILSDEISTMRQHIRAMADSYLLSEDETDYRQKVFSTYMVLDTFLAKTEKITLTRRVIS
jgi:hypothetical protein